MTPVTAGATSGSPKSFFTIGYQFHTSRTFLSLLAANRVKVLVDVRQNPVSRKRGFSKRRLEESTARLGIGYLHFPCLGTPIRIRRLFGKTGDATRALEQYEKHLRVRRKCLESLVKAVSSRYFCLLCLESDYNSCHRSVIADRLTEMTGCQAVHLQ